MPHAKESSMELHELDQLALTSEAKHWFAKAIVGMICADGHVDDAELAYLKGIIAFLESKEAISALVQQVKKKEKPILRVLKVDRQQAFEILKLLTRLAATDSRLSQSEAKFLKYAGVKLGFEPSFSDNMLRWAVQRIEADKMEKELWEKVQTIVPNYTDKINQGF